MEAIDDRDQGELRGPVITSLDKINAMEEVISRIERMVILSRKMARGGVWNGHQDLA